jgi:hypothetical protein
MEGLPHFDFIIAADCIYKEKQVQPYIVEVA